MSESNPTHNPPLKTRSVEEIKAHIADLKLAVERPCDCAKTGHDFKCFIGRMQITSTIIALEWAISNDQNQYQGIVDHLARVARQDRLKAIGITEAKIPSPITPTSTTSKQEGGT